MTARVCVLLIVALIGGTAIAHAQGAPTPADAFRSGQFGKAYAEAVRPEAADQQLAATWNSFFGREDLDGRIRRVPQASTQCESGDADAMDGAAWILGNTQGRKVLMFNDNHMHVGPRAFLLMLLPALREQGFTHIGFEALLPQAGQADRDPAAEGFYTVEPVFAALVRKARSLGFTVFGYESLRSEGTAEARFEAREQGQARNIARQIADAPPAARFVVFAGFAHIQTSVHEQGDTRRYMASYLKEYASIDPLSIDLVSCGYPAATPGDMRGKAYTRHTDGQPLISGMYAGAIGGQVRLPMPADGDPQPGFYRQLLGAEIHIPASLRRYSGSLLVEGRDLDDTGAVAYDRVLLRGGEDLPLYLPAGHRYDLVAYRDDGTLLGHEKVRVSGNSRQRVWKQ